MTLNYTRTTLGRHDAHGFETFFAQARALAGARLGRSLKGPSTGVNFQVSDALLDHRGTMRMDVRLFLTGRPASFVAVTAAVILAGCLSANQEVEPVAPAEAELPPDVVVNWFEAAFSMNIRPDPEIVGIGGLSDNCVFFWDTDGAEYSIQNGTATLTWVATPTTTALRVRTTGAEEVAATGPGGSPLVLEFGSLTFEEGSWGVGFWVDYSLTDLTVPVAQDADLALQFSYVGPLPDPNIGTCSGGGP